MYKGNTREFYEHSFNRESYSRALIGSCSLASANNQLQRGGGIVSVIEAAADCQLTASPRQTHDPVDRRSVSFQTFSARNSRDMCVRE